MKREFQPRREFISEEIIDSEGLTNEEKLALEKLDKKFNELANLDSPVFFTEEERLLMRRVLEVSGATNREFLSEEALKSLSLLKFRGIGHERGFGVVCVLGMERAIEAMGLCDRLSARELRFKDELLGIPTEESRSRGHYQLLADLLSVAYLEGKDLEEVIRRMNRRLWKGAIAQAKSQPEEILTTINSNFRKSGICKEPDKLVARALPKNIYPIWMAITGREIVEIDKKVN